MALRSHHIRSPRNPEPQAFFYSLLSLLEIELQDDFPLDPSMFHLHEEPNLHASPVMCVREPELEALQEPLPLLFVPILLCLKEGEVLLQREGFPVLEHFQLNRPLFQSLHELLFETERPMTQQATQLAPPIFLHEKEHVFPFELFFFDSQQEVKEDSLLLFPPKDFLQFANAQLQVPFVEIFAQNLFHFNY